MANMRERCYPVSALFHEGRFSPEVVKVDSWAMQERAMEGVIPEIDNFRLLYRSIFNEQESDPKWGEQIRNKAEFIVSGFKDNEYGKEQAAADLIGLFTYAFETVTNRSLKDEAGLEAEKKEEPAIELWNSQLYFVLLGSLSEGEYSFGFLESNKRVLELKTAGGKTWCSLIIAAVRRCLDDQPVVLLTRDDTSTRDFGKEAGEFCQQVLGQQLTVLFGRQDVKDGKVLESQARFVNGELEDFQTEDRKRIYQSARDEKLILAGTAAAIGMDVLYDQNLILCGRSSKHQALTPKEASWLLFEFDEAVFDSLNQVILDDLLTREETEKWLFELIKPETLIRPLIKGGAWNVSQEQKQTVSVYLTQRIFYYLRLFRIYYFDQQDNPDYKEAEEKCSDFAKEIVQELTEKEIFPFVLGPLNINIEDSLMENVIRKVIKASLKQAVVDYLAPLIHLDGVKEEIYDLERKGSNMWLTGKATHEFQGVNKALELAYIKYRDISAQRNRVLSKESDFIFEQWLDKNCEVIDAAVKVSFTMEEGKSFLAEQGPSGRPVLVDPITHHPLPLRSHRGLFGLFLHFAAFNGKNLDQLRLSASFDRWSIINLILASDHFIGSTGTNRTLTSVLARLGLQTLLVDSEKEPPAIEIGKQINIETHKAKLPYFDREFECVLVEDPLSAGNIIEKVVRANQNRKVLIVVDSSQKGESIAQQLIEDKVVPESAIRMLTAKQEFQSPGIAQEICDDLEPGQVMISTMAGRERNLSGEVIEILCSFPSDLRALHQILGRVCRREPGGRLWLIDKKKALDHLRNLTEIVRPLPAISINPKRRRSRLRGIVQKQTENAWPDPEKVLGRIFTHYELIDQEKETNLYFRALKTMPLFKLREEFAESVLDLMNRLPEKALDGFEEQIKSGKACFSLQTLRPYGYELVSGANNFVYDKKLGLYKQRYLAEIEILGDLKKQLRSVLSGSTGSVWQEFLYQLDNYWREFFHREGWKGANHFSQVWPGQARQFLIKWIKGEKVNLGRTDDKFISLEAVFEQKLKSNFGWLYIKK